MLIHVRGIATALGEMVEIKDALVSIIHVDVAFYVIIRAYYQLFLALKNTYISCKIF